jgi:DNA-binding NtrC family response regulator
MKRRILIADNSPNTCEALQHVLEADLGVDVTAVPDGRAAMKALLSRSYSILITALKMPRVSGMELIEELRQRKMPVNVIVLAGNGSVTDAVQAMRLGASDCLTKPVDPGKLLQVARRALNQRALEDEVSTLREQMQERHSFQNLISKNQRMHEVFELISYIAPTTATILLEGETGTGKDQAARAIHQASGRTGRMVAVSCAALPDTLLESELFGHEKGAFTGAANARPGRFELADQGTIFLDEAGDIPPLMQAKLLRVLQDHCFERVGGTKSIHADVRVIAASNRPLQQLVAEGKFREDLFYRLNVVRILLPPLRERREDIPLLVTWFVQKYARPGEPPPRIAPATMEALLGRTWPGNIREVENAIERACVTCRDSIILPENLPADGASHSNNKSSMAVDLSRPLPAQLAELVNDFEDSYLRQALRESHGHVGRCARICGLSRRSVTDKLASHNIDRSTFKAD